MCCWQPMGHEVQPKPGDEKQRSPSPQVLVPCCNGAARLQKGQVCPLKPKGWAGHESFHTAEIMGLVFSGCAAFVCFSNLHREATGNEG